MTSLASIRIVTADAAALVTFYEHATGLAASWPAPGVFAEIRTVAGTLAITSTQLTDKVYGSGIVRAAENRSMFVEFLVDDVDAEYARLQDELELDVAQEPTTMPWGNRSVVLRDPDGNLVNLFTPVTPEARARAGRA